MRNMIHLVLAAAVVAVTACDTDTAGPTDGPDATAGVQLAVGGHAFAANGGLTAVTQSSILAQQFAVARADSLNGVVIVAYDSDDSGSGDLFIIQAPNQAGTYACGESASCHGRFITGVPASGNTSDADRYFEITSGTLIVSSLGAGQLKGTFTGTLTASDQQPDNTMSTNGSIDVPFLAAGATDGTLACLLSKVGIGSGSCS